MVERGTRDGGGHGENMLYSDIKKQIDSFYDFTMLVVAFPCLGMTIVSVLQNFQNNSFLSFSLLYILFLSCHSVIC